MNITEALSALEKLDLSKKVFYFNSSQFPTYISSWRGDYSELALDHVDGTNSADVQLTGLALWTVLDEAIGAEFEGYKGGEYIMHLNTEIWVDNYGQYSENSVIDIVQDREFIFIKTDDDM